MIKNNKNQATGASVELQKKILTHVFDKYQLEIIVDDADKFIGVQSIGLSKSFLKEQHKKASIYDVSEYYDE